MKKKGNDIIELYHDFQRAYDNDNRGFPEKLLEDYGSSTASKCI